MRFYGYPKLPTIQFFIIDDERSSETKAKNLSNKLTNILKKVIQ